MSARIAREREWVIALLTELGTHPDDKDHPVARNLEILGIRASAPWDGTGDGTRCWTCPVAVYLLRHGVADPQISASFSAFRHGRKRVPFDLPVTVEKFVLEADDGCWPEFEYAPKDERRCTS